MDKLVMESKKHEKSINLDFPKSFFWGASTSAHQVEGGNFNQWSGWELENANSLSKESENEISWVPIWDEIKQQAQQPENYVSGKATDHYNRYEEDFDLVKSLNMNAFRFSIEWSRVEPKEGKWNAEAIQHYRNYLKSLKAKKIEPFVTLWHWTVPVWFAEKGGFAKRRNIKYFLRFAEKIFTELGSEFKYVITINEPEVYMGQSYVVGNWPPQHKNTIEAVRVYLNLAYAHKKIYKMAKTKSRRFKIGLTKNCSHIYAGDDAIISKLSAKLTTWGKDYLFLDNIKKQLDFIGLNYYFSDRFYGYKIHNPDKKVSDLGWDMQPQNIQFVLERLYERYKLPIIITENGCADSSDQFRKWWLMRTLIAMHKSLKNGVKLEGYLHWSLIDNFEWAYGFWPKFGLIEVEPKTLKRKLRPSAVWFSKVIKQIRNS